MTSDFDLVKVNGQTLIRHPARRQYEADMLSFLASVVNQFVTVSKNKTHNLVYQLEEITV